MELAGLACAQTLAAVYRKDVYPRVLVCCGPGNQGERIWCRHCQTYLLNKCNFQGGDGLVAARHLGLVSVYNSRRILVLMVIFPGMFGYRPTIYMPKVYLPFIANDAGEITTDWALAWCERHL
jgi:NAD(P)H-hydrate epimerase